MKQKLLNNLRLRAVWLVAMILCAVTGAWADSTVLFHETFGNNTGSARNWDDSYSEKTGVSAVYSGITGYTVSNAKQGKNTTGSTQSGLNQSTSGTDAYIIIGPLNVANYESLGVTYQWKAASIKGTYTTKLEYATSSGGAYSEVSGTGTGATGFVQRSYSLPAAAQVSTLYLKITWNTSNTQAIIDEVELTGISSGGGGSGEATTTTIDASDITITNKFVSTTAGSLSASVTYGEPAQAVPEATVTWSGNNDAVATINPETGAVTLVGAGTVTFTATYAGVIDKYLESSDTYEMTVTNEDPDIVTIWSEDFSDYSADDVPSGGTYGYVCVDGKNATKIYENATAGGTSPELLINRKGTNKGSFSATIPLNHGYVGTLKLLFKNNQPIEVSATDNEDNVLLAATTISANTTTGNTLDIEGVTTDITSVTILWSNGTSNNVRIDDIVLKGSAVDVPITSITFSEPKTASVAVGGTVTLTPTVLPVGYNETVDWESDAEGVATVSSTGVVTGVAAGTAHITAKAHNNPSTIYDVCEVTVTAPVAVTGVALNKDETSIVAGSTETLTATVSPNDATNKAVTWETSDPSVATVDAGVVTAVAAGTATITVKSMENQSISAECAVTVTAAPGSASKPYTVAEAIAAIDASEGTTGVYVSGIVCTGGSSLNNGSLIYWISDDGTETNKFEIYKGKGIGGANFTSVDDIQVGDVVTVYGNITYYESQSIYEFASGSNLVSLLRKDEAGLAYKTEAYNANLGEAFATPELTNPNSLTVTYSSSDESVATVDENTGAVTLVAAGETIITATFAGNEDYQAGAASYTLTVIDPSEPVDICIINGISPTTLTIGDMGDFELSADFVAHVAEDEDYEISWTSSNTDILEVAGTTYEAKAAGEVTITVNVEVLDEETYNNVSKSFTVKVEAPKTYYALVAEHEGKHYAVNGTFNNKSFGATVVDAVNGKVINGKSDDISWEITEEEGGVSFLNKNSQNYMGSTSSKADMNTNKTAWTTDGGYHIGTRYLSYQSSGNYFKNFAESNLNVGQYSGVTTAYTFARGYTREVTANNFGTICLPYNVKAGDFSGVKFYQIVGKRMNGDNVTSVVLSDEVTSLVGGAAYIYQANADAVKLIAAYSGDEVAEPFDAELSETGLIGTYEAAYIPQGKYVLKNNTLFFVNQSDYVKSGANKAYIDLGKVPVADANVKGIRIDVSNDYLTGINGFDVDGRQNVIFNLSGQRVSNANKGVYIVNGKKISVK